MARGLEADRAARLGLRALRCGVHHNLGLAQLHPFVVRDDNRASRLCVVLPFSTYQAYNMWPADGRLGKSLYYGYDTSGGSTGNGGGRRDHELRARKVSFDRPYSHDGMPHQAHYDLAFIQWLEKAGYDVTYATSHDLHAGRIDVSRYPGLVFSGHDEYWSRAMRDQATQAVEKGTSLAFMSANNAYWHVRFEPSATGQADRVVACFKTDEDPSLDGAGSTTKWRNRAPGPGDAEQRLLGVQYRAMVVDTAPLVIQSADHWVWANCDVKDGDTIDGIVGGEADDLDSRYPKANDQQVLLSASPYRMADGTEQTQNTSVYETAQWCHRLRRRHVQLVARPEPRRV